MKLETKFNLGDVVWHLSRNGEIQRLTLGQVRVEVTDSPGIGNTIYDNFKAQRGRKESYMAVETGIGSGYVYDANDLFSSKKEAENEKERRNY